MLAVTASAATINITPTSYSSTPLNQAVDAANANDTIVLAAGTYVETSGSGYINFNKNVVIKAADESEVIIDLRVPMTIQSGARAEIIGLKFDATHLYQASWYTHIIYADDASENNRLIFEGCEFYNDTIVNSAIYCASNRKLDSCVVNNCKFHDIARSCMFFENAEMIGVSVTNSTFYNITNPRDYYSAGVIDPRGTTTKLLVDHCTFYNCEVRNTDYGVVKVQNSTNAVVSNCIFAMPSTYAQRAIHMKAGNTVNNSLVYNYTASTNGIHYNVTPTNSHFVDPLFTDAANDDFSFNKTSPAYFTGANWSHIGDPRWFPAEPEGIDLPAASTDEAVTLNNANIEAKHPAVTCDGDGYYDMSYASDIRWTAWTVNINPIVYDISAFVSCNTGWHPDLYLYDLTTGAEIASRSEEYHGSTEGASFDLGEWDLTSVNAGKYLLVAKNNYSGSHLKLKSLTLSYVGGAVQDISSDANTTLNVADAWFTSGATRAEGQITYESWNSADSWVKWNIATTETKFYDLTLNFSSDNAHSMAVNIYEDEEASPVATVSESWTDTHGTLTLTDRVNLVGGKNYIVKVTNPTGGSHAKVTSVVFAPVVATATELPGTLAFNNAVLSEKAFIQDGMLYFNEIGDTDPRGQWAQWEVTTDHNGLFLFTMGVTSDNGQDYKITIKDDSENVLDYYETSFNSGDKTVKHYFALETGSYFVKVENTRSYSKGHLTSLVVTEPDDIVVIDETEASMSVLNAENRQGNKNYQIIRTIVPGMYNTICLPFDLTNAELKAAFGSDVVLKEMESATVEAGDFVLNLNFKEATSVRRCRPYLIKTSRNIVNPVFGDVEVKIDDASEYITTGTNANFVSTLIKGTIPASENNLFLGANNTLYFPTVDMPILGMRAYFVIHDAPSGAVKRARIIEREQIITDVELVAEQPNAKSQKILRDGQLIIIRDGNMYNVMGAKLQ